MYRSLKKRILSGLLAGLMVVSNVNITANAADVEFEASVDADDNITVTEESDQTYDSGQDQEITDSAPEESSTESEVDFAEEEDTDFSDGNTETDQAGTDDSRLFALEEDTQDVGDETAETTEGVITGRFSVSGKITYDENLNGVDWSSLVRPNEFDQPIMVRLTYKDSSGNNQEKVYKAQDDLSQNDFYLKFEHDGNGGGNFTIENIPKSVKDADGTEHQVTECSIYVDPTLPYYKCEDRMDIMISDPKNIVTSIGSLKLSLNSQKLTLQPTVIPADSAVSSFVMDTVFTNPQLTGEEYKDRNLSRRWTVTGNTEVQVPVGISYNVTQKGKEGYKFDGKYTTSTTTEHDPVASQDNASGIMESGSDVTISTVNYAQNVSVGFDVKWLDNNKSTRPSLSDSNFVLQYRIKNQDSGSNEWIDVTEENYAALGMSALPKLDMSQAGANQYSYKGLPASVTDENGGIQELEYQVVIRKNAEGTEQNPSGYVSSCSDDQATGRRTFTFEEQTGFSATITWNDEHGISNRPDSGDSLDAYRKSLRLYRKIEGADDSTYELVYAELPEKSLAAGEGASWSVNIPDLPRYNAENKEYDYVLVQGTIDNGTVTQTPVNEFYKTYYDNGSGNFGNDIALCHNNGKITEVLHKKIDFEASKVWKDPNSTSEERPVSTVTLWRYVKNDEVEGIDDAYEKGLAALVVFHKNDGEENIVSYNIDTTKDSQSIKFTAQTVHGMSEDYELPAYDDHGREYVYFVRESLSGTNADDYEIQYTSAITDENGNSQTTSYVYGAPAGGTITNVRREKAAVAITKIWQNPAGLKEIDGTSVQVKIEASADEGNTYEELQVYSSVEGSHEILGDTDRDTAQTITGFTSNIAQGEVVYYVNIYDSQGRLYDMKTARITELVKKDGQTYEVKKDAEGNSFITIGENPGSVYAVRSTCQDSDPTILGNGMKQYRYTQTNTITASREYKLIKVWDKTIGDDELKDITAVNFKLERRTTKDKADGSEADYSEVLNADDTNVWMVEKTDGRTWETTLKDLPRYDEEGYEYYYRATEISFVKTDGTMVSTADKNKDGWYGEHYRTPEQTRVINRRDEQGGGYFAVSKIWQDNGDSVTSGETRKNVKIRIYSREQLKTALNTLSKTDTDIVDWNALESLKHYDLTLTSADQYTKSVYYNELKKTFSDSETADSCSNYIVLEYAVGENTDQPEPAQYTYGQLQTAAEGNSAYNISGTVENGSRQYRTKMTYQSDSGRTVFITNTRMGSTKIDASKTWNDEENASGLRPSTVKFQLYRDGSPYTSVSDKVSITSKTENIKAELERSTGIITLTWKNDTQSDTTSNNTDSWSFMITGLDMFSSTAVPYTYNLDELASDVNTESKNYSYIQKKSAPTVEDNNKTQTYTFAFENTITGTISHVAYKYWKDVGVSSGNRPDLYMNLYRYLKSDQKQNSKAAVETLESYKLYTGYKDQIWTAASTDGEYEKGYNWKIAVNDLPRFDENGDEYGYVFTEKMNNDGKTVFGTYVSAVKTKTVPGDGSTDTYEVFTNTISDYMTIQGKKTWTGFAGYQTGNDLPDPLITLYRTTDSGITNLQGKTDEEINTLINGKKITLVDTTHLTGSTDGSNDRTRYTFPDTNVSDEEIEKGLITIVDTSGTAMLPKFDADGNRYTYLVRETIDDAVAGQLYSQVNTNGTLSNTFRSDVNRRNIIVTKIWAGRKDLQAENKYPSVMYKLYRYEAGNEANTTKEIARYIIKAKDILDANGSANHTFENLLVYSPTGVQYCYYIKEYAGNGSESINGYTISYTDEKGIDKKTLKNQTIRTGQGSDGRPQYLTVTEQMLENLQKNNRMDVISLPDDWDKTGKTPTTSVSVCNTYHPEEKIQISGEKAWDDYGNSEGLRPSKITVTLTRHTGNESGQENKVDSTQVTLEEKTAEDSAETKPYIVWNKEENSLTAAEWTYTIYNLERYAPNGMPYVYTLSEDRVDGYARSASVSKTADSTAIKMAEITNRYEGSYYVRKNWMDGNNKYNLRPSEITVKLQRSTDNGTTWSDMIWPEGAGTYDEATGKWRGLPSVISNDEGDKIVSITLNAKYVKKNTKNNTWEYTFTNLPKQDKAGKEYIYRCVETAIGGVPITEDRQTDGSSVKYSAGAYECKYTIQSETQTIIENTLNSTSLVVTKKWEGDQDNLYQTRPDKLTFVLQKRGVRVKNEEEITPTPTLTPETTDTAALTSEDSEEDQLSDWTDVLLANGKPYTFTISPDSKGNWTKTLEDLPTAEVYTAADGTKYTIYSLYFRAVEVHANDTTDSNDNKKHDGTTVSGAQNYEDTTDYTLESTAHKYDKTAGCNISAITNTLRLDNPAKSITVTKKWKRVSGTEVTATFELLYKTTGETEWHSYGDKRQLTISGTATSTQTVKWEKLPKYDRDGNELVYKVVEYPIDGYKTEISSSNDYTSTEGTDSTPYDTKYTFTNIELQDYTVKKIWKNTDYAEKNSDGSYTATFKLQQKIEGTTTESGENEWKDVAGVDPVTLKSQNSNDDKQKHTWKNLPKYTVDGKAITYRAVETQINGKKVENNTNGSYIVSYKYKGQGDATTKPAFGDTETTATNRMIYGFVNLSKQAAYLAPEITNSTQNDGNQNVKLAGVKFNIYQGTENLDNAVPYVSGVTTDANGNLTRNADGTYGTEHKYLIAGTYTLKEEETLPEYSVWKDGVTFTVGSGALKANLTESAALADTGEHGTAWISTTGIGSTALSLKVEYKSAVSNNETVIADHYFNDTCTPYSNGDAAVNLESRGVISFTKTGPKGTGNNTALDTHADAAGESSAYFGVYLDEACTQQVAGMVPKATITNASSDKTTMILTNKAQDGNAVLTKQNDNGIPYLRVYSDNEDYPFTLLSGTYYIKELVAPAGYKLDTTVRKAEIAKIDNVSTGDLTELYPSNKARIMLPNEFTGSTDYNWSNEPNIVTLYKLDQFGRNVSLKESTAGEKGYLELKVENGKKFPSGEDTIRLYQNADTPATKTDGTTKIHYITYDEEAGAWTIKGLLDINTTYTLSEPETSVHDNYIIAKTISFKMNADGTIAEVKDHTDSTETDTEAKDNPLRADGTDYKNCYKANASNNQIVMRDAARYLKDVALQKKDSTSEESPIANISFKLYKYDNKNAEGTLTNEQAVLAQDVYLTTDSKGTIDLKSLDGSVINQITNCKLKNGLDIGKYYFKEVERGASDKYRLAAPIFFEIKPKTGGSAIDYSDYAEVVYDTSSDRSHVATDSSDNKKVIVKNDPVTSQPKTLELSKVDSKNGEIKLARAKFTLTYQSVNHNDTGAEADITWTCITDSVGVLYLTDSDDKGSELPGESSKKVKPDISKKGTYTLKETQAPDGYMTPTANAADVTVTFQVNSDNKIVNVNAGSLITATVVQATNGEDNSLNLTVENEKTKLSIAKQNDIESATKTCDQKSLNGEALKGAVLEIYEGTKIEDGKKRASLGNEQSQWTWMQPNGETGATSYLPEGTLNEDTIYTLHESSAPVGYLKADDIYFKLSGTVKNGSTVVSQLYVWTGSGEPTSTNDKAWKATTSTSQSPTNLKENVLTMVDETIIAPVDLQKVLQNYEGNGWNAVENVEFTVKTAGNDGNDETTLGTAVTNANGYLVWKSITPDGYASKLIYDAKGKLVTEKENNGIGQSIILKQNATGYVFTETYAPDHVYNDGRSYHVSITAENYKAYRKTTGSEKYNTEQYINLVEAENETRHEVETLSVRTEKTAYSNYREVSSAANVADVGKVLAVNLPYKSTVTLHKYDANEEGQKAAIPGTEFTLYRVSDNKKTVYTKAYVVKNKDITLQSSGVFTTDANGNLAIEIHEKGTYILKETKAAAGYQLDEMNFFEFKLADNAESGTNPVTYGYQTANETNTLQKDNDGVPNQRIMGSVSLTKKDNKTNENLDGVVYTLTRTDAPKSAPENGSDEGTELSDYLLQEPVDVVTGKSYKAEKVSGKWQLTEITDASQCKSGEIHITGLNWGTYTLKEKTELSGYKQEEKSHAFKIGPDNTEQKLTVTFNDTNTKNSVTFYKTNQIDPEAGVTGSNDIKGLAGAVFEVHEGEPGTDGTCSGNCIKAEFYASDKIPEKTTTVTTGADGKVTIYGLATDPTGNTAKTYHLTEVTAPKGYKLQTRPVVFTIDRQGKVQVKGTDGKYSASSPSGQVIMTDEAIKIYIHKVAEDGTTALKGAKFVLKDTCSKASGVENCDHKLANNNDSEEIMIPEDDADGKIMIPIERVIGGHTYTLTETKAPDGYECTAVVTFRVGTDGTIDTLTSEGGYRGSDGNSDCASLDNAKTTISIRNEKVCMILTKEDYSDSATKLGGVTFTLKPCAGSSFATIDQTGLIYDTDTNTYTFVTDANSGKIIFPQGLLKHDNSYLLQEAAAKSGYYLSSEAKDGVILQVGKDGGITVERLEKYKNKTVKENGTEISSCPVTVQTDSVGKSDLTARNMKAASFTLTKKVEGNMGDLSGTFQIKMEVYEPDGTKVGEHTVNLKMGETYDSENGTDAFGLNAIPTGATLVITEDNELNYAAEVKITSGNGEVIAEQNPKKGVAKVKLTRSEKVQIELTNKKDVAIDVGVHTENQTPWAAVALIIPAVWMAYRYRRKRRGGER